MRLLWLLSVTPLAFAGPQLEKELPEKSLVASVTKIPVVHCTADLPEFELVFEDGQERQKWLTEMSRRLKDKIRDQNLRECWLKIIRYEAKRAALDPQLILSVIDVESGFRKDAVSSAGARGLMQVMPFWVNIIGTPKHNLFDVPTSLRYGSTILAHYQARENGNLERALGRYNGSLGRQEYPAMVKRAWETRWQWHPHQR